MPGLLGKKIGMTSVFGADGKNIPCTVIEAGPCVVTQLKTVEKDGYEAVQVGFMQKSEKHTNKAEAGHFKAAGVQPMRHLAEFDEFDKELKLGDTITVADVFEENQYVDVIGTSKGKGFQGVVKRHGFGGVGQSTHGQDDRLRAPGSVGACAYPSRVFPGTRMGGHMGQDRVTVQNLVVLKVIPEYNLIMVKGSIPGAKKFYRRYQQVISVMELSILNQAGKETGKKIVLNDTIFAIEPNDHAIYLDVKQYLANNRQGTAKAKQRSENAHSTRKLGRQKGGGGARPGDMKSPVRVGGGTIFGPVPRSYDFKLNRKVKQLARKSALSLRAKQEQLIVLDALSFEAPKTKAMIEVLNNLKVAGKKVLFVLDGANENACKSAANLQKTNIVSVNELNTYTIMNANVVVLTEASAAAIEATFNA